MGGALVLLEFLTYTAVIVELIPGMRHLLIFDFLSSGGEFWFSEYVKCLSFDGLLLTQGFEFLTLVLVWVNWISDRFYLGDIGDFSDKELRVHT